MSKRALLAKDLQKDVERCASKTSISAQKVNVQYSVVQNIDFVGVTMHINYYSLQVYIYCCSCDFFKVYFLLLGSPRSVQSFCTYIEIWTFYCLRTRLSVDWHFMRFKKNLSSFLSSPKSMRTVCI